jgi:serine/threonine protein kinase
MAPECFNHTKGTHLNPYRLDIYSLGVLIIEILTGEKACHDVDKVRTS